MAIWASTSLYCRCLLTSSALFLNWTEAKLDSWCIVIVSGSPVYLVSQKCTKSFQRLLLFYLLWILPFRNRFLYLLYVWKLFNHIWYNANYLLNTMYHFGIDALKRKGGIEYSENLSHFPGMPISNIRNFSFVFLGKLFLAGYINIKLKDA